MRKKLHGLKKVKVRQTWNKYNLYNLTRMTIPSASEKTFFQQKWNAKALTRAYHGEHIRERQWQRMFRTHMPSVAPLDHKYLAEHDGSEMAAGRGSGLDEKMDQEKGSRPRTPYMHMVYHPTERRLDTTIFRALFASSTRQARQFVVHGAVKVNGKKMIYPGYLLNPGDMFSVDPDRVMFATGARKDQDMHSSSASSTHAAPKDSEEEEVDESEENAAEDESASASSEDAEAAEEALPEDPKKALKTLLTQAKAILSDPKEGLSAKRKQDLRAFQKTVKQTLSRSNATTSITDDLEAQLLELTNKLNITSSASDLSASTSESEASEKLSKADEEALKAALERARENPIDDSKPYATPWRPRDYMSAFAFIPRYLEVNQNICSAVYLRHPVARPGLAEVPTPFHGETNQLAFNWYLRRR